MGRRLAQFCTSLALLCASFAWAGWIYLHTIGDPQRIERVAMAVVDDPAARAELASSFADQLAGSFGIDPQYQPVLESAVLGALSDPRVTDEVIAAVGAAHADALGVGDGTPSTIDTATFMVAVHDQVEQISPEAAALVPSEGVGELTLPQFQPPGVGTLRRMAEPIVDILALAALGLLTFGLLVGDRRSVLRRYGFWAIGAGLGWLVVPLLVNAAARAWASGADAIIAAAMAESRRTVLPVAMGLAASGALALVLSMLVGRRTTSAPVSVNSGGRGRGAVAPVAASRRAPAAQAATTVAPQQTERYDTFVRSSPGVPPPVSPQRRTGQSPDPWAAYFDETPGR